MTVQQILEAIEELSEEDLRLVVNAIEKPKPEHQKQHRSILELAGLGASGRTAAEIDADINEMRDEWDAPKV